MGPPERFGASLLACSRFKTACGGSRFCLSLRTAKDVTLSYVLRILGDDEDPMREFDSPLLALINDLELDANNGGSTKVREA